MLYRVAQFYEDATDWTERGKLSGEYWPLEKISGLTEQMLFLKECSNA
jgi:hypothetical protein